MGTSKKTTRNLGGALITIQTVHTDWCPNPNADFPRPCPFNPHWAPLAERCFYCAMPYKVIAKYETFQQDLRYIASLSNATFQEDLRENVAEGEVDLAEGEEKKDTLEKTINYFKQLKVADVEALYNLYKDDFLLFGYSTASYIAVALEN